MKPPLVAHIIHRLAVGGLENGLINLINGTDSRRYRHAIISLTDCTEFRDRIRQPKVPVVAIQKQPGKDFRAYGRLWRVLKELNPAIVHTRNLPALEFLAVAAFAGVGGRVHGVFDEARLEEQILGEVAREEQLRQHEDVGLRIGGLLQGVGRELEIGRKRSNLGVELRQGDAEPVGHWADPFEIAGTISRSPQ